MKNKFISALLLAVTFCLGEMHSQDISKLVYTEDTTFSSEEVHELRFRFRNLNFFRDNEYKGSLVKGYTLPGLWVLPTVSYQPLKTLKIEAGAYMLRYWGESKYPNTYYANLPGYESGDTQSAFHAVPFSVSIMLRFPAYRWCWGIYMAVIIMVLSHLYIIRRWL